MRYANLLAIAALLALPGAPAEAGHRHRHFHGGARIVFFAPVFVPRYYYPPVYYSYPAPVYYSSPPVYIEQPQPAPRTEGYWYYCRESNGYYPHVRQCPGGWQRVAPQPPPG